MNTFFSLTDLWAYQYNKNFFYYSRKHECIVDIKRETMWREREENRCVHYKNSLFHINLNIAPVTRKLHSNDCCFSFYFWLAFLLCIFFSLLFFSLLLFLSSCFLYYYYYYFIRRVSRGCLVINTYHYICFMWCNHQ